MYKAKKTNETNKKNTQRTLSIPLIVTPLNKFSQYRSDHQGKLSHLRCETFYRFPCLQRFLNQKPTAVRNYTPRAWWKLCVWLQKCILLNTEKITSGTKFTPLVWIGQIQSFRNSYFPFQRRFHPGKNSHHRCETVRLNLHKCILPISQPRADHTTEKIHTLSCEKMAKSSIISFLWQIQMKITT